MCTLLWDQGSILVPYWYIGMVQDWKGIYYGTVFYKYVIMTEPEHSMFLALEVIDQMKTAD